MLSLPVSALLKTLLMYDAFMLLYQQFFSYLQLSLRWSHVYPQFGI